MLLILTKRKVKRTMSQQTLDLLLQRKSIKQYDANYEVTEEQLRELLTYAAAAPSAWNLQHWKFLVIHSEEAKQKLLPLAYYQSQIKDSSATIIILGDVKANENAPEVFKHLEGTDVYTNLLNQINGAYAQDNYGLEAAHHNTAYAAMQLMIAAEAMGLSTNAIGGFDPQGIIDAFNIDASKYLPIVLITVGQKASEGRSTARFDLDQLIEFK